ETTTISTTSETTTTETTTTETTTETTTTTLPQTGYSEIYNYIMLAAAAMVFFGIYAIKKSREEIDTD
ncbi:MAG: LPXTG cell wall anchor domain-containing protein, partial [Ruminococcus sp.]|nr:LPXTG cell wall anchor domain-containing protein [Ruminococcus sp.]